MQPRIRISQLIEKMHNPRLIGAQLKLYNDWLEADDEYRMENLIPVLVERLEEFKIALSDVSAYRKGCTSVIEEMADGSLAAMGKAQALSAVFRAQESDDSLAREFSDIVKAHSILDSDIRHFMLGFLEQDFEELSVNLTRLDNVVGKLNEMRSTRHFDIKWAWERLQSVRCDLQKYSESIEERQFQPLASDLYGKYRAMATRVDNFHNKLLKKRSSNPVIVSSEQAALCTELNESLEQLGTLIHKWVNALYQHEQLLLTMISRLKVYRLLSDKLQAGAGGMQASKNGP